MLITHKDGDSWAGFISRLFDYVLNLDNPRYKVVFEFNTFGAILINGYELTLRCTVVFTKTDVAVYVPEDFDSVQYLILQERENKEI